MNVNKRSLNQLMRKIISRMIRNDAMEWPPICAALIYQPKRPCLHDLKRTQDISTSNIPKRQ